MVALGVRFAHAVRELFRLRAASFSEAARELRREHERRVSQLAAAKRIGIERLRGLLALQVPPITRRCAASSRAFCSTGSRSAARRSSPSSRLSSPAPSSASPRVAGLAILPVWALIHLGLARQRHVDPSRQLADRATQLATLFPAAFIVMGHTHIPQTVRAGAATYVNVGSWAEHEDGTERAARTHLVIHVTPEGPEAQFCTWSATGPERLG